MSSFLGASLFPASLTFVLAVANLVISQKVLKPVPGSWKDWMGSGAGFHWVHIWAVTLGFQSLISGAMYEVYTNLGKEQSFWPYLLWFASTLLILGYTIIYRIELSRLHAQRARSKK